MTRLKVALLALLFAPLAQASVVRVDTQIGHFYIDLLEQEAPRTVANFLNYVRDGDYANSIVHRVEYGFVIQGGGFTFIDGQFGDVPVDATIANEFGLSNVRGTVAMAKIAGDPDSADSQWFINMDDANAGLDNENGGFTVFGRVMGNGMEVVDRINSLVRINTGQPALGTVPVKLSGEFAGLEDLTSDNLIFTVITEVDGFEINPGLSGTWFNAATPGQGWLIDIIDEGDRQEVFVAWFTYDVNPPDGDDGEGFGSTQHRWLTASGTFSGDTATLTISRNTGGVFNDPTSTTVESVGTLVIQFTGCGTAILSWEFDDPAVGDATVDIIRLSPDSFCGGIALPAE
ncbi:MAG: peptidylprolyl isomerase [Pseudomonadota bacterium]